MSYASLQDVNVHLPLDKVQAQDADIPDLLIDAQRLVRARLWSTFDSTTINGWTSPTLTPELIREITGKLVAAKFYANLVAEDDVDGSAFAEKLYNEAIAAINDIRSGAETVIDITGEEIEGDTTELTFYPDDTAPAPAFAIGEVWS